MRLGAGRFGFPRMAHHRPVLRVWPDQNHATVFVVSNSKAEGRGCRCRECSRCKASAHHAETLRKCHRNDHWGRCVSQHNQKSIQPPPQRYLMRLTAVDSFECSRAAAYLHPDDFDALGCPLFAVLRLTDAGDSGSFAVAAEVRKAHPLRPARQGQCLLASSIVAGGAVPLPAQLEVSPVLRAPTAARVQVRVVPAAEAPLLSQAVVQSAPMQHAIRSVLRNACVAEKSRIHPLPWLQLCIDRVEAEAKSTATAAAEDEAVALLTTSRTMIDLVDATTIAAHYSHTEPCVPEMPEPQRSVFGRVLEYLQAATRTRAAILLHGPAGAGKTSVCHALRRHLGNGCHMLRVPSLLGANIGDAEKSLREARLSLVNLARRRFATAAAAASAAGGSQLVVIVEDVDALCVPFNKSTSFESTRAVAAFTKLLDTVLPLGVRVLMTASSMDDIDESIFRSGRVAYFVKLELPAKRPAQQALASPTSVPTVVGFERHLQQLHDFVLAPLDPAHASTFKRLGVGPIAGAVIWGGPGTGKSSLVEAFAFSEAVRKVFHFMSVSGADIVQKIVGESEKRISRIFAEARAMAPCILCFDKIDAIAPNKLASTGASRRTASHAFDRILSTFLMELDGISTDTERPVVVIATTTELSWIDPSLLRPGRLQLHIHLTAPSPSEREHILRLYLDKMPVDPSSKEQILSSLAASTPGCTGADLQSLCIEAAMSAIRRGAPQIERQDFTLLNPIC